MAGTPDPTAPHTGRGRGSIALVGFGLDSLIELAASLTALWRLGADLDPVRRERAEWVALRVIGVLFLALAAYVALDSVHALAAKRRARALSASSSLRCPSWSCRSSRGPSVASRC